MLTPILVSMSQQNMGKAGNPWLGTFLDQMREAGTPASKRRLQDTDDELDMVQCAKRPRLENIHAPLQQSHIEHSPAPDNNQISAYYAHTNVPQSSGRPPTYRSGRPLPYIRPSPDPRIVNPTSTGDTARQPTNDNRTHDAHTSPYKNSPDLAEEVAQRQQIASNMARLQSPPANPRVPTTHQAHRQHVSSYDPRAPAGMVQRQTQQVLGHGQFKNALLASNEQGQTSTRHEQREGGFIHTPLSHNKTVPSPSPSEHQSGPQTSTSGPVRGPEQPSSQSTHTVDIMAPPRLQTYYERTGGTHENLPPSKSGIYANQDFKTGKFIDCHGSLFSNDRSGPYRYLKPVNRGQELAIMQATYQTISDFEIHIGCSPRCFIDTMESYERQYQQIQKHLEEVWLGPPESIPKLKCVEGWNTCHIDHITSAPLAADTIPADFILCQPGASTYQPCCIEHEKETWTKMGCVRNLETRLWQDWGDKYFSDVKANK